MDFCGDLRESPGSLSPALGSRFSFAIQRNFQITSSSAMKNPVGVMVGVAFNLQSIWEKIDLSLY